MTRKKGEPTPFTNSRIKREQTLVRSNGERQVFENHIDRSVRVSVMDGWKQFTNSVFSLTPKQYTRKRNLVVSSKFIIELDDPLPCDLMIKELMRCVRQVKKKVRA